MNDFQKLKKYEKKQIKLWFHKFFQTSSFNFWKFGLIWC